MNVQNAEFTAATGFFVAMCECKCIEQPVTISKAAPTKRKLTIVNIISTVTFTTHMHAGAAL